MPKQQTTPKRPVGRGSRRAQIPTTERGFERIDFTDAYGESCSLQESSCISPHIWLGCNNNTKPHHGREIAPRMHLTRNQVIALVNHLVAWLDTSSFAISTKAQSLNSQP